MSSTSLHAQLWRAGSPSGGRMRGAGSSWRPPLLRSPTSCSTRVSKRADDGVRALRPHHRSGDDRFTSAGDRAGGGARTVHRPTGGPRGHGPLRVGCRARRGIRMRRALGKRPYSRPLRTMLWLNLLLPVHDDVHRHRESVSRQYDRMVPLVAPRVRSPRGWLGSSAPPDTRRLALSLILGITPASIAMLTIVEELPAVLLTGDFAARPTCRGRSGCTRTSSERHSRSRLILAYVNPDWVGWAKGWSLRLAFGLLVVAMLITQSRQALIGLLVAIIIIVTGEGRPSALPPSPS